MQDTPDTEFDPAGFADAWWYFQRRKYAFNDHLLCMGDEGFDYVDVSTDDYDSSIEINKAAPDARLNEAQQEFLWKCGFSRAFVNHTDGIETHYTWKADAFVPHRGWRRRHREGGGFDINYWPEGWNSPSTAGWRELGYMTVIPDL